VFYGPVVAKAPKAVAASRALPAFVEVDEAQQWDAFSAGVPAGTEPPIGAAEFSRWAREYRRSSRAASASCVRIPAGPLRDLQRASDGSLPYDPAGIRVPSLVVRGTWDAVTTEEDSIRFLHALSSSASKRLVWIHGGTHRLHLERPRMELFSEVRAFLR
jgi:pimeloyl-ACP methyl ester carboxylesterase